MDLSQFRAIMASGDTVEGGSPAHEFMHGAAQEALRTCAELNGTYRTPAEVHALLCRLTGQEVPESVAVFPPLHSESARTCTWARTCSSTWAATSRTPPASPSETAR